MNKIVFPEDFLFGVATSAAQIEGAANVGGRSPSIWDNFAKNKDNILDGSTPTTSCDFYNLYKQDIKLAKEMNIKSFRFSFSWSRIFPNGVGEINEEGVDFYKRVIDELLQNEIIPNATVYHWDLPQALEDRGGWLNRDIASWYGEYTSKLFRIFGNEIPLWATINEPIATYVGYSKGIFAPGHNSELEGRCANHNILRAHGEGIKRFREENLKNSKIGIVVDIWNHHPYRKNNLDDIKLAELENEKSYRSYLNPIFNGSYTDELIEYMEENSCMPDIQTGDYEQISQSLDFFGLNCYNRVLDCADKQLMEAENKNRKQGGNFQDNGQEYYPKSVYDAAIMMKKDYGLTIPIYITENGTPSYNECVVDKKIHDNERIKYIKGFLYWIRKAINEGVDIKGYYVWSLTDNWEWNSGFQSRFGLIHVDFDTQKRTVKDSGIWYADTIQNKLFIYEEDEV
ncbi:MAG: GH1 family beta-glucosidase [Suipraeoptans sp.]